MNPTTISNVTVVAQTIVQLATLGVIAYGIKSAKEFLVHWLDKRVDPLVTRRAAVEAAIDEIRKKGIDAVAAEATA